jgi:MFS superfamily sulfate permease-like transporter
MDGKCCQLSAVKFTSRPVVVGFTNGIAVIIASTQVKDFFGRRIEKVPGEFAGRSNTTPQTRRSSADS